MDRLHDRINWTCQSQVSHLYRARCIRKFLEEHRLCFWRWSSRSQLKLSNICSHPTTNNILVIGVIELHKPIILEEVVIALFPI